jgi:hypothetical protein
VLRPCLERGCPRLSRKTRCPEHERAREVRRGTSTQRGYNAEYRRNRAIVLAASGVCAYCGKPAETARAVSGLVKTLGVDALRRG